MTTKVLPDCITIQGGTVGIPRWFARCAEHPDFRPGSHYDRGMAEWDARTHARQRHDGIDRTGMPPALVEALAEVADADLRRRLAAAARAWRGHEASPRPALTEDEIEGFLEFDRQADEAMRTTSVDGDG